MMMMFEVVCPEKGDKFSYYSMHLDHRLIKNVVMACGGCMVELITGQVVHVNEPKHHIDLRLQYCRAGSPETHEETHPPECV
jgi:hypothetical protein